MRLHTKILGWLALNLLIVSGFLYFAFQMQFRFGLDSLLAGRAGERIQTVARLILGEINHSRPEEWDAALERFSKVYNVRFALFDGVGRQLAGSRLKLPEAMRQRLMQTHELRRVGPRAAREEPPPPPQCSMVRAEGAYWVMVRLPPVEHRVPPSILIAQSQSLSAGGLFFDPTPWAAVGSLVLVFSVLFWIPMVSGITRSLSGITAATGRIAEGQFDVRLASQRRDELGQLSTAINTMASRLDHLVRGQKRFLGDVAHELCSPLARLELALGILEQRVPEDAYLKDAREELQHMSQLVNELLSFSKAALEVGKIQLGPVSVQEVVRKTLRRETSGSDAVRVDVEEGLQVLAEPELLQRSLANLVRNALRYAGHCGPVSVVARSFEQEVLITVVDCGPGIPEEAMSRVFDPFYRVDHSRDRQTGGVGLGLAIVKTCIESCGGALECSNRKPSGLEVVIRLAAA